MDGPTSLAASAPLKQLLFVHHSFIHSNHYPSTLLAIGYYNDMATSIWLAIFFAKRVYCVYHIINELISMLTRIHSIIYDECLFFFVLSIINY
jgi:hypothetical protein